MAEEPITVSGGPAVEHDTAMPGRVYQRTVRLSGAGVIAVAGSMEVQITSTSPLSPTPLSPEALAHAGFVAQLISTYVGMKYESPETGLIVGLVLYLTLIEFARLARRDQ